MIRLLASLAVCGVVLAGTRADEDAVGKQLSAAKEAFVRANEKARMNVVAELKRKADAAQKAGDLKTLEKFEAEIQAFEEKTAFPKSISPKGYEAELKAAKNKLELSYSTAVKEYTKLGQRENAKAAQQQLDDFKLGGTIPGLPGAPNDFKLGAAGGGLAARTGEGKDRALAEFGGNAESEAAVARALAWLARQQKPGGNWEFDPRDPKMKNKDWATATGMALLPFLGAGYSQKDGKYRKTLVDGLAYLRGDMAAASGKFAHPSPQYMYGHGITALALCEAYAQTGDAALRAPAQAAVNLIVNGQGADGSWGYQPATAGDTSIVGWQLQALFAARQGKLVVPDQTVTKVVAFLDRVGSGSTKSVYGYAQPNGRPGTSLTAVGLWSRYHFDGWTADTPGMRDGVAGLAEPTRRPKSVAQAKVSPGMPELYYYYYATQVMHRAGGDAWRDWFLGPEENGKRVGGMRDWLVTAQSTAGADAGSWSPDPGTIGSHCGRVGSTALAVLILETPYRYLPLPRQRP